MTDPVQPPNLRSSRPFLLVWAIYSLGILLGVQVQDALISKAEGLLPFIRPSYEAWLVAPLTRLPYRKAYVCFLCINLLLLLACFFVGRDIFSRKGIIAQPRPGLQLFAFFPVTVAMLQGQDSILFLLGLCAVYRVLRSGRVVLAGAVLGLLLFKLQVAIPVALFLAARYGISLLAGFAAGGTFVFAASIAVVGWHGFVALVRVLLLTGSVSVSGNLPAGSFGVCSVRYAQSPRPDPGPDQVDPSWEDNLCSDDLPYGVCGGVGGANREKKRAGCRRCVCSGDDVRAAGELLPAHPRPNDDAGTARADGGTRIPTFANRRSCFTWRHSLWCCLRTA